MSNSKKSVAAEARAIHKAINADNKIRAEELQDDLYRTEDFYKKHPHPIVLQAINRLRDVLIYNRHGIIYPKSES